MARIEQIKAASVVETRHLWVGLAATWLVAVNLRTGLIGVGPVLPRLTSDLGLSQTQGSVLVALPTALMGLAAVPGGRLADRWGARTTITLGLALVAAAGGMRAAAPGYATLVLLTILFGAGIGLAQPALPRLARGLLPTRIGLGTGVYAAGFFAGSVLSAFLTGPVLLPLTREQSWRVPLTVWGALALGALVVWVLVLPRWQAHEEHGASAVSGAPPPGDVVTWSPWRDRGAWVVAALFAGQGLAYYLLIAWLPSVYADLDLSGRTSGALFAVFNLATFPGMVGLPALSDRLGTRRLPTVLAGVVFLVGALGLASVPGADGWRWVWPVLAGGGVAGLFAMSLVLPADVAPPGATGVAAGMVLGIGYLGSALGPVAGGAIHDVTGSFTAALAVLPVVGIALVVAAMAVPESTRSG